MKNPHRAFKRLQKKSKRGARGFPVATIAFYGPDDKMATKVAVGIIMVDGGNADILERWFSAELDIRRNQEVGEKIREFIEFHGVKSVVMTDGIMGCPHQEGTDYPDGGVCPICPFWKGRDRFTGKAIH